MDLLTSGVPWFPQEHAETFYVVKGVLSLVATLMLLAHMSSAWSEAMTWGRRLRYLALLYFAVLLTSASVEQVRDGAVVNYRNLGAIVGSVLLITAVSVSMLEARKR